MADQPYRRLPKRAYWERAIATDAPGIYPDLYQKRFEVAPEHRIATAGSCFAQHIARNLGQNDFTVLDLEPAPRGLSEAQAQAYGYKLYSARFGNIYLVRQLLQLAQEAFGSFTPEDAVWVKGARFYDALRPSVEPSGLNTVQEVELHRKEHLSRVRKMLKTADIFVFTMGLTEGWVHKSSGTVYPLAPGVLAGAYDPDKVGFRNFGFNEIYEDFVAFRAMIKAVNPDIRFILTVSPVPLKATVSGNHALTANLYSKSVLRAVAGALFEAFPDIDYFPSYEIIASSASEGRFFDETKRGVTAEGVATAMRTFFEQHKPPSVPVMKTKAKRAGALVCEEELLGAFAS